MERERKFRTVKRRDEEEVRKEKRIAVKERREIEIARNSMEPRKP